MDIKKYLPENLNFVNFEKGRGKEHPEFLVVHIVGAPGVSAKSAEQHFFNPKSGVSSHYLTCRNGDVIQFVRDEDTAYGNGIVWNPSNALIKEKYLKGIRINQISLSIEHEGSEYEDITEAQYKATSELIRTLSRKWNIPITGEYVIPHFSIRKDKVCPGRISVGKLISLANSPLIVPTFAPPATPTTEIPMWMKMFIQRTKALAGYGDPVFGGVPRSSKWNKVRDDFLKDNPFCEACGVKADIVHHILPYHFEPNLELDESNLISLCSECHLVLAHLKSFKRFDPDIKEVARLFRKKVKNATISR